MRRTGSLSPVEVVGGWLVLVGMGGRGIDVRRVYGSRGDAMKSCRRAFGRKLARLGAGRATRSETFSGTRDETRSGAWSGRAL